MPVSHDFPNARPFWPPRVEYVAFAIILLGLAVLSPMGIAPLPLKDFVEYWSAGDVFVHGGNAYDAEALSGSLSSALGQERASPTMMWNPPWTLPLIVPFALLPMKLAHVLWVAVQLTLTLVSANLLWRAFGGRPEPGPWFRAAVILFPPTFFLLVYGQIGAFCLFGIAGFLFFMDRERPVSAGMCVALTAIKPHLLFAFGLYLILEALVCQRTRIALLAAATVLIVAVWGAYQINPHVYGDYVAAMTGAQGSADFVSVQNWRLPLGSFWLRRWAAPDKFWVQFLPALLVALGTVVYWAKAPGRRPWYQIAPGLVLVSLLAAPYGGWLFDLVLLLVPVTHVVTQLGKVAADRVLAVLTALNIFVLAVVPAAGALALERYVWFAPTVAVGYAVAVLWLNGVRPRAYARRAQPPLVRVHA